MDHCRNSIPTVNEPAHRQAGGNERQLGRPYSRPICIGPFPVDPVFGIQDHGAQTRGSGLDQCYQNEKTGGEHTLVEGVAAARRAGCKRAQAAGLLRSAVGHRRKGDDNDVQHQDHGGRWHTADEGGHGCGVYHRHDAALLRRLLHRSRFNSILAIHPRCISGHTSHRTHTCG
jgi:hypothetical protein